MEHSRSSVRHVQHDGHGVAVVTPYKGSDESPPRTAGVVLPARGSPTPAVSVAHYGVIEVLSPGSNDARADISNVGEATGYGADSSVDSGNTSAWYSGPWGALLCDIICFRDDFARKDEALFWDAINAEEKQ